MGRTAGAKRGLDSLSEAPLALWDLEEDGGGPGGGPGRGMPGSQVACRDGDLLPQGLLDLELTPPGPIALVETALLDDGGTRTGSALCTGPREPGVAPCPRRVDSVDWEATGDAAVFPRPTTEDWNVAASGAEIAAAEAERPARVDEGGGGGGKADVHGLFADSAA